MIYTLDIFFIVLQFVKTQWNILKFNIYLVVIIFTAIYYFDEIIFCIILVNLYDSYSISYLIKKIKLIEKIRKNINKEVKINGKTSPAKKRVCCF